MNARTPTFTADDPRKIRTIFFRKGLKSAKRHDIVWQNRFSAPHPFPQEDMDMAVTRITVALYIISAVLAVIGIPMLLVMIYLGMLETDITSIFMWSITLGCCIMSILAFSMARILVMWAEEDENIEE